MNTYCRMDFLGNIPIANMLVHTDNIRILYVGACILRKRLNVLQGFCLCQNFKLHCPLNLEIFLSLCLDVIRLKRKENLA